MTKEIEEKNLLNIGLSLESESKITKNLTDDENICKLLLYVEISNSRIRVWDLVIFLPNLIFLIFLAIKFKKARLKLRATSSPIFLAFYGIVWACALMGVMRCIFSMTVNSFTNNDGTVDKILWIITRFFLLSAEMSVVTFGLAFGHLDSRNSIKAVLICTGAIALAYTITQGALDIVLPDDAFHITSKDLNLFGHGGMLFWFISSIIFSIFYLMIFILPWTSLRDRLALPTKRSFYLYVFILFVINSTQSLGAVILKYNIKEGFCLLNITSGLYFTLFTPLVYVTFLSDFFGVSQPSILFSYKAQVDDTLEDDNVSLPHQQSFSSLKTDSEYIYQSNGIYDSTQFDSNSQTPINQLYSAAIQSPDSITGYSIESTASFEIGGNTKGYNPNNL